MKWRPLPAGCRQETPFHITVVGSRLDYLVGRKSRSEIEDLVQQEKIRELITEFSALSAIDQIRIMDMIRLLHTGTPTE